MGWFMLCCVALCCVVLSCVVLSCVFSCLMSYLILCLFSCLVWCLSFVYLVLCLSSLLFVLPYVDLASSCLIVSRLAWFSGRPYVFCCASLPVYLPGFLLCRRVSVCFIRPSIDEPGLSVLFRTPCRRVLIVWLPFSIHRSPHWEQRFSFSCFQSRSIHTFRGFLVETFLPVVVWDGTKRASYGHCGGEAKLCWKV